MEDSPPPPPRSSASYRRGGEHLLCYTVIRWRVIPPELRAVTQETVGLFKPCICFPHPRGALVLHTFRTWSRSMHRL